MNWPRQPTPVHREDMGSGHCMYIPLSSPPSSLLLLLLSMCILGSREHACIHPEVSQAKGKNDECRKLLEVKLCVP